MQSIMPYKRCAIVIFTLKLTKDYRSVEKMSLRMCFHAFSHNRGDVQKISLPIGYRAEMLSPAFDSIYRYSLLLNTYM